MAPAHAIGAAERVSRHPAWGGHSASRFWRGGRVADPWTAQLATTSGRTARKPGDRGGSRSGSWLRPDGPSGCPSWRRPSAARLRARLDTREFELGNLQLLVPPARPSVFPPIELRMIDTRHDRSLAPVGFFDGHRMFDR